MIKTCLVSIALICYAWSAWAQNHDPLPVVKLSPTIRVEPIERSQKHIPMEIIKPFLIGTRVVSSEELDAAPYIVSPGGRRLVVGSGHKIFVRNLLNPTDNTYNVFRRGIEYVDPQTNEVLGWEAIDVGDAQLQALGDPSTFVLTRNIIEAQAGDRLLAADDDIIIEFTPKVPERDVDSLLIAVHGGVTQIGLYNIVAVKGGLDTDMQVGDLLSIYREGEVVKDRFQAEDDEATLTLPDELAGELMVFRVFEHVSLGVVLEANQPMYVHDRVKS